ncbi:MAG: 4Fe-4S binding protein [Planctomycetota bacterium]
MKTGKRKVIARVVDAGTCRYYRKGRTFVLGRFTPKGLCDSAYVALSRDAQTMRAGGTLPWEKDGRVLTRCPDPAGALWELRLEGAAAVCRPDSSEEKVPAAHLKGAPTHEVRICRGREGGCPFALTELADLVYRVEAVVERSGWEGFLRKRFPTRILPHQRLKIALAACPNTCTQPQIKDFGIIATMRPTGVTPQCNGCGKCEEACEEGAMAVREGKARLDAEMCVGCGMCIEACPQDAIATDGLSFRILVGGKLGRHPAWARELCRGLSIQEVPGMIEKSLAWIMEHMAPRERVADVVDRLGPDALLAVVMGLPRSDGGEGRPKGAQDGG